MWNPTPLSAGICKYLRHGLGLIVLGIAQETSVHPPVWELNIFPVQDGSHQLEFEGAWEAEEHLGLVWSPWLK